MSGLVAKIESNKVVFYNRFFEGIGATEYTYIDSMSVPQLTNFIEHLSFLKDKILNETEVKLNNKKYNLHEAFALKKELDAHLEPFKDYIRK